MDLNQITLPSSNYEDSVEFYTVLGLRQIVDSPPRYARFETEAGTTLSIHLVDSSVESPTVTIYFEVDDVDAQVRSLQQKGLSVESEPVDQRWLWREAYFKDPAGNMICIYHAGENRRFPPWRMSKDDV